LPRLPQTIPLDADPLWYKDAVIYELHVRSFQDSDGDGIGDFPGLTQRLEYLQDLGVTALWLLPFFPSPLRDDGYDISDYTNVHSSYGTLRDFEAFLREAHRRGIRVIIELILNHTSDQHPWFQRARRAPAGSRWRNFYVWSDTPDRYQDARVIFKDFESSNWSWDPVAKGYYWHRFYSHQPDLNFESPDVRRAMERVVDFWLGMGVDGLRLDAVPYLYEADNTTSENLPQTHAYLKELRAHIDQKYPNRMLLAEANQWPEDASAYFGAGDESHMAFHFPVMPRMFMGIRMEDRFPIVEILRQTPPIPENCQWALFLRNHDELTLEMVTDEERDYMNRVYGQDPEMRINLGIRRRLAPLLRNNRRQMELMKALLFSMPGTPVIYYGDEIAMGDNVYLGDRNGVRTPMQWNADRNAGFSRANPQRLYLPVIIDPEYHYESVNVEAQQNNPHFFLWWMKRLLAMRKRYHAFGRGDIRFLYPENRKVLAFVRNYRDEHVLVVANLSRFVQAVQIDLSAYAGRTPVELFGHTEFPAISEAPYFLSLGPHAFYWFALQPAKVEAQPVPAGGDAQWPRLSAPLGWTSLLDPAGRPALDAVLPQYLAGARWFGGKARPIRGANVREVLAFGLGRRPQYHLAFIEVDYFQGESETYLLPLAIATGERAAALQHDSAGAIVARLLSEESAGDSLLIDATWDRDFEAQLLEAIMRRRSFRSDGWELRATPNAIGRQVWESHREELEPAIMRGEQSNTSINYGSRLILKLFRRLDEGVNPDLEISRYLTERSHLSNVPAFAGSLELYRSRREPMTVGMLQRYVRNEGDAWQYTLDELSRYFETVLTHRERPAPDIPRNSLLELTQVEPPEDVADLIGPYLESARLLGRRTGELHIAFASALDHPAFAAEPFTPYYQRSLYQGARSLTAQTFQTLRSQLPRLHDQARRLGEDIVAREDEILHRFQAITSQPIKAMRLRCHGDYHLGQALYTGNDFVIIDFEGEPARPLSERRIKRSPLRDVAGMIRSFHYAANSALMGRAAGQVVRKEDQEVLEPWATAWQLWVSVRFLGAYLETARSVPFLPEEPSQLKLLLNFLLLDKAIYELGYELNNRPDWVSIPLNGLRYLLETPTEENA